MEGSIDGTDYLEAHFTGRWSCVQPGHFLMKRSRLKHQQALIDSQIEGKETEDGAEESRIITWRRSPALNKSPFYQKGLQFIFLLPANLLLFNDYYS